MSLNVQCFVSFGNTNSFELFLLSESRFIFTEFARENTFDPLVSVNWFGQRKSNLQAHQVNITHRPSEERRD